MMQTKGSGFNSKGFETKQRNLQRHSVDLCF